ncbi:Toxin SymE, type I toxin-antitoxin system [Chryseobacterium taichungense]|uniref:Toxin SymE, type I toxin-antitoxin system n=1 Tax=Chryseobacterium taichungense TaxID=295069 RepID=A0A1H7XRL5_9FLAO|nr:SymE family type I addiction module toxin [Chryseobacterium taichungense]SEM35818.1 Toxin SymE, type I toxin-antitoxin system [Chryseobacterium taichungense]
MMNSRRIKINTTYQKSSNRMITVSEIRLKGKWLEKLGFEKGKTINIKQNKNKLTITVAK